MATPRLFATLATSLALHAAVVGRRSAPAERRSDSDRKNQALRRVDVTVRVLR